jgi:hypothetical protein
MTLKVGFGIREITPPMGVELAGYGYFLNRRCDGVEDPLYARAVAFDTEGKIRVLIDCDLLGLARWMVDAVRGALRDWYGIAPRDVMLLSTHTHTGPAVGGLPGCGQVNPAYSATVPGLLLQAAVAAIDDLAEVDSMERGRWTLEHPVGYNRTGADQSDQEARAVIFRRGKKKPVAMVNYACHPVTYGRSTKVSADFPGAVTRQLEKRGCLGVFLNGVCGDIDPVSNLERWGSGTTQTVEAYGAYIVDGMAAALTAFSGDIPLAGALWTVEVQLADWSEQQMDQVVEQVRGETGEVYSGSGYYRAALDWRRGLLEAKARGEGKLERSEIQVLTLGDLVLVGLAYEAFTELAFNIRAAFPNREIWVLGNANATTGYMPRRKDLEEGSGYGTVGSCIAYGRMPFDQRAPEIVVEKACGMIRQLEHGREA